VGAWGESSARRRRQPGRYSAGLPESSPELDGVSGTIVPANRAELLSGWQRLPFSRHRLAVVRTTVRV